MYKMMMDIWRDENGQGLTEYALVIALVAVAITLTLIGLREQIKTVFQSATDTLAGSN